MKDGDDDTGLELEFNVKSLEELVLPADAIQDVQAAWNAFITGASSKEAAGEAIYNALFDSAPSLRGLFTTPRAVQAMTFMSELTAFVTSLDNPSQLKAQVETLAFKHLNIEVTVPRATIFRDAILDLLEVELGDALTTSTHDGVKVLLNYIAGAIIFVRTYYSDRLRILTESWKAVNSKSNGNELLLPSHVSVTLTQDSDQSTRENKPGQGADSSSTKKKEEHVQKEEENFEMALKAQSVPTTFKEMFEVNAQVIGIGNVPWMKEVLASFDAIVSHVTDSTRLKMECDVLLLRMCKVAKGPVNLPTFKSCMLASLRSLLPKEWDSSYEVAWSWLWEMVERLLVKNMGSPPIWEKALKRFDDGQDEASTEELYGKIFARFFVAAPAGQDFFKQSNSRLQFIAKRAIEMASELLRDPWKMVDDLSALGLRHVGYGIPTDLFSPFVTAALEVIRDACQDAQICEAFRWTLGVISSMLVRTVTEGSTIVMKAINVNSARMLRRAISYASRGSRVTRLLLVQVGSQSISPLVWAIESGSLDAASAILKDLLTIRADRERYYYGAEELFLRHPDIVKILCQDAPSLLPKLFDGLVWRSKLTKDGSRRVNYYIKHLLRQADGTPANNLKWLVNHQDPKLISHPTISSLSDLLWVNLVCRQFIWSKVWFIFSLVVFMLSQAALPKLAENQAPGTHLRRVLKIVVGVLRLITYLLTMRRLLVHHMRKLYHSIRHRQISRKCFIAFPHYWRDPYEAGSFTLMTLLIFMCASEPILYCLPYRQDGDIISLVCSENHPKVNFYYSLFGMTAMILHWMLIMDLAVFYVGLSAFVLVIGQVLSEIGRFLYALVFLLLTFGSAISVLQHQYADMKSIPRACLALFAITIRMYEDDFRDLQEEPALLAAVFLFVTLSAILLLNLLIAQLNCSYVYIYADMVGFARLNRAGVIVETLTLIPEAKWKKFLDSLNLDKPLEFNEGDVGLPGGFQVLEPAKKHVVTEDSIYRYGGNCSQDQPWPEETVVGVEEEDKLDRVEKQIAKTMRRLLAVHGGVKHRSGSNASSSLVSGMSGTGSSGYSQAPSGGA